MTGALILNVDDNDAGRYVKSRVLRQGGYEVIEARTGIEALEMAAERNPDLMLLDVKLPDVSGLDVCRLVKSQLPNLLVLQISASFVAPSDRATGLDSGADAYLSQPVEPSEMLATLRALLRLRRAEQAAQESNELYRVIVQSAIDYAIVTLDLQGRVSTWSRGAEQVLGWSEQELAGRTLDCMYLPADLARDMPVADRERAARERGMSVDRWQVRKDGRRLWASLSLVPLRGRSSDITGFILVLRDRTPEKSEQDAVQRAKAWLEEEVTARTAELVKANEQLRREIEERQRAEQALRQAQKMEAVGQLTGGIAHDFNNMLTVVLGTTQSIKAALPADAKAQHRRADLVMQAAMQAAALTHRLLAFSRPQPSDPKSTNLNAVVGGLLDMLRRTIGESITLRTELTAQPHYVVVDANQLENAILNLALNARDAMPTGGTLTVRTALLGDDWVTLTVTDDGAGMPPEVRQRALEPFFTTKQTGEGTGLGLSQVYNFMKQSAGSLHIESEPGRGTSIELRFPRSTEKLQIEEMREAGSVGFSAAGRPALVVEDQEGVREHTAETLRQLEFDVVAVGTADAALALLESDRRFDLLVTDIGLPGQHDGWALASAARSIAPAIKIVLMTGYAQPNVQPLDADSELLMKPFLRSALESRLARLFGRR
jgi:PAS domain S-box-containing protein